MEKELDGLEEGPKAEILIDSLRKTLKLENTRPWWHTWILVKKFTSINDTQDIEMNRCIQEAEVSEWMTKGKSILIQKDSQKETTPKTTNPLHAYL